MPSKRQNAHLRCSLQPLDIHTVAQRSNQQRHQLDRSLSSLHCEDDDPFASRPDPGPSQPTLLQEPASSDELHYDVPAHLEASIACLRRTTNLLEPPSSDELHRDVPARPQASIARLRRTAHFQEPVSSDELHRDVSARPQASIARLRVTANLLEPASSNELHYDHIPARPQAFLTRPQAIVDRLEPDSSDELLRAFRSLPCQPDAVQTRPRTARRSEVRRQQETEASPQRRRRVPEENSLGNEYGPGIEGFFADVDGLYTDMQTLNLDYYSDTFAGAVLQTEELLDIAREPHRSNV
jgi:hypothetical protein